MSTALKLAQTAAAEMGIPVPSSLYATANANARQLGALLNAVLIECTERWNWPQLTREASFQYVETADKSQGTVESKVGAGFKAFVLDSGWNRTRQTQIFGPIDAVGWAALRAFPSRGLGDVFRIREGQLFIDSAQVQAGDQITFEFYSSHSVVTSDGLSQVFTGDSESSSLPDSVLLAGLRWRWKYTKGLSYAEDKREFELMAGGAASRTGTAGRKYMDDSRGSGSHNTLHIG